MIQSANCSLLQLCAALALSAPSIGIAADAYVPGPGAEWARVEAAAAGMDAARLADAIEFAKSMETDFPSDFSMQQKIFGRPIGPVPTSRAATNGMVLRKGYIVAEWGDTAAVDPVYSAAKSFLSTLAGIASDRGLIEVRDPVKKTAKAKTSKIAAMRVAARRFRGGAAASRFRSAAAASA